MRTFIALKLSQQIRNEIAELQKNLRNHYQEGVKWIEPKNLHITLIFIGETSDSERQIISNSISEITHQFPPLFLQSNQLEFIPRVKPHILWLKLFPLNSQAKSLYYELAKSLLYKGIRLDLHKPVFHITLARIKKRLPDINPNSFLTTELINRKIEILELALMQSKLSSAGANYFQLENFSLDKKEGEK